MLYLNKKFMIIYYIKIKIKIKNIINFNLIN